MTAVDRAAEIMNRTGGASTIDDAEALAAAGLLVTPEIQAVLDAAIAAKRGERNWAHMLWVATGAYLASRGLS